MAWDGKVTLSLYIDVTASGRMPLLEAGLSDTIGAYPILISGDEIPVRLYFMTPDPNGGAPTAEAPAAGSAIVLAGKKKGSIADEAIPLFLADDFAEVSQEDYWEGTLNLDTVELDAALGDEEEITVMVDVEISVDGSIGTFQFPVTVKREVQEGEGEPVPGARSGEIAVPAGSGSVALDLSDYQFSAAPRMIGQVLKPSAGADNIFLAGLFVSATAAAFELSAAPGVSGYKIVWHIV